MTQNHLPQSSKSYSAMGHDRHDYDAFYGHVKTWGLYGLHCHDFYEFYIHFSGAKYYCIDNQVYPIGPYDLMFLPPFRFHGLVGENVPENYERCFLYISPAMLKACGAGVMDLEYFFTQRAEKASFHFHMTEEEGERCKVLMREVMEAQGSTAAVDRYTNFTKIVEFLSILCRVMNREEKTSEPIIVNEAMQDVLTYINEHYTSAIKLEEVARTFGVSVSFLSHEFVKYTGRSVYDYVLYRRIRYAKQLIAAGTPLNEVAYQCGFNDYSSFLRSFTKMAGMSPSAYRKSGAGAIGGG